MIVVLWGYDQLTLARSSSRHGPLHAFLTVDFFDVIIVHSADLRCLVHCTLSQPGGKPHQKEYGLQLSSCDLRELLPASRISGQKTHILWSITCSVFTCAIWSVLHEGFQDGGGGSVHRSRQYHGETRLSSENRGFSPEKMIAVFFRGSRVVALI